MSGAPGPGWGVASISVGQLREFGFSVERDPIPAEGKLGSAHVAATPREYVDGQIPPEIQVQLAADITWVIRPEIS